MTITIEKIKYIAEEYIYASDVHITTAKDCGYDYEYWRGYQEAMNEIREIIKTNGKGWE